MTDRIWKREEQAVFALRSLYSRYGYVPYKMSHFEEYELYVHNKDFLVSDQIITFSGEGGRLLALKPDVTLSIVKNAPQTPGVVQKVYYDENVYRDYREIRQAGLECVGDLGEYEISEVVMLAERSLSLMQERFALNISHMGLISAVLDSCGLTEGEKNQAMDCLRGKNLHGLRELCQENLPAWEKLRTLAACRGRGDAVLKQMEGVLTTQEEKNALGELAQLWRILESGGWTESVRLDFSVGSDLGYYSGVVFRGYLEGIPTSVLSGGQYDKLPRKMGRRSRAIGFAIYLDMLQQRSGEEDTQDIDTLIVHDGSVDTALLAQAAAKAAEQGSVLVSTSIPKDRTWKQIKRFEKGVQVE